MLRTIWFYFAFLGLTPFYSIIMILFGPLDRSGWVNRAITFGWSNLAVKLSGINIKADLTSLPDPTEGPVVFLINHQSQFDIPIAMSQLRAHYPAFIAKKSLFWVPLLGWTFAVGGHVPIDRSNRRAAMRSLKRAAEIARNGRPIVIYPEGTRQTQKDQLGTFHTGGLVLALETGLPIVPVVLEGTGDILPKGQIRLSRRHMVQIKVLPPVSAGTYSIKDRAAFRDDLYEKMNNAYLEMRACRANHNS